MANDNKSLIPKLRFPEFQDNGTWKNLKVSDLLAVRQERKPPSDNLPLFSLTIEDGVTAKTDRYNREFLVRDTKTKLYKVVCPGDIVYNPGNLRWGAISQSRLPHSVVVSPIYEVLYLAKRDTADERFISAALTRPEQIRQFISKGQGTLVERIAVKIEFFLDTEFPIPESVKEQQKIANCLTSLDELIAAQGRKVDALKAHKAGLMQQLFPREGATIPRLRFSEFRDGPDWDQTSLEQLVDMQSGGTPSKANPAFWSGSIPWVSAKDMKQFFLDDAEDHISVDAVDDGARLVPAGTLLMLTRGMTLLKDVPICVLRREMSFNQDVKALRPKDDVDGLFLAFLLLRNKHRVLRMVDVAGHGTGKLNTDELKALGLVLPQPAEQQRIAHCLSTLHSRIAAETGKLTALKTHKKSLMQQLFPSPE